MKYLPGIMSTFGGVVLKNDSILYVRQTYGRLTNKWTLPGGLIEGQSDQQERIDFPESAAVREVLEEGNVNAKVRGLIAFKNYVSHKNNYMFIFVFLCDYVSGSPQQDGHETSEACFLGADELEQVKRKCDPYCYWIGRRVLRNEYSMLSRNGDDPYFPLVGFH